MIIHTVLLTAVVLLLTVVGVTGWTMAFVELTLRVSKDKPAPVPIPFLLVEGHLASVKLHKI